MENYNSIQTKKKPIFFKRILNSLASLGQALDEETINAKVKQPEAARQWRMMPGERKSSGDLLYIYSNSHLPRAPGSYFRFFFSSQRRWSFLLLRYCFGVCRWLIYFLWSSGFVDIETVKWSSLKDSSWWLNFIIDKNPCTILDSIKWQNKIFIAQMTQFEPWWVYIKF